MSFWTETPLARPAEKDPQVPMRAGVDFSMVEDGCFVHNLYSSRKLKESNLESTYDFFVNGISQIINQKL